MIINAMDFWEELLELLRRADGRALKERTILHGEKTERIILYGDEWSFETWKPLMEVLQRADVSRIKELHFDASTVDQNVGLAEVLATGRFSALQSLRLMRVDVDRGWKGSEAVARALKQGGLTNLRELILYQCGDVKKVLESIESAELTHLFLGLSLTGDSVEWVRQEVESATGPMDSWECRTSVADVLEKTLTRGQWLHLETLRLLWDALGGRSGFAALVHGIERGKLPALKVLQLCGSRRSLGATCDLARLVVRDWFKALTHLDLGFCGIQVSGLVQAIIRAKQALALQILDLSGNDLEDAAIDALLRLANSDLVPQLAQLLVRHNRLLSSNALHKLVDALPRGHLPSLEKLGWEGNPVTNADTETIVGAYGQNEALTAEIAIVWYDRSLEKKARELRERNVRLRKIKDDLKDELAEDVVPVFNAKVSLCEAGEVGKTTFWKSPPRDVEVGEVAPTTLGESLKVEVGQVGKTTLRKSPDREVQVGKVAKYYIPI